MRFVFLTQGYHPDIAGGGYRYATELAELLAGSGHETHVLCKNPGNELQEYELRNRVALHRLPSVPGGFWRNWPAINNTARSLLRRLLAPDSPPTLLLSHHAYFEPASRPFDHTAFFHGPWALEHRLANKARPRSLLHRAMDRVVCRALHQRERRALQQARHILVASHYIHDRLHDWHRGLKSPVQIVGGGANFAHFHPPENRADLRTAMNLLPHERVFVAVRRLDPRMGLRELVQAFSHIAQRHPEAHLWIAGKGPLQQELADRIDAAGLQRQARLLGFVPESRLADLYGAADTVIMPSLDLEGFGLVTAEAMACGTPVLASNSGANAELVQPLDPNLLFPPGDVAALSAKLEAILTGRQTLPSRADVAEAARRRFRWERPAQALESLHTRFATPPTRS